jgi:hypothetical protein
MSSTGLVYRLRTGKLSLRVWLQVRVGYIYLKRVLKVSFPDLRNRAAAAEAEARAIEVKGSNPPHPLLKKSTCFITFAIFYQFRLGILAH